MTSVDGCFICRQTPQVYFGFKELVWRDGGPLGIKRRRRLDIARILALFPNVFVVRNFRLTSSARLARASG